MLENPKVAKKFKELEGTHPFGSIGVPKKV
jgi:hypothetical protein